MFKGNPINLNLCMFDKQTPATNPRTNAVSDISGRSFCLMSGCKDFSTLGIIYANDLYLGFSSK